MQDVFNYAWASLSCRFDIVYALLAADDWNSVPKRKGAENDRLYFQPALNSCSSCAPKSSWKWDQKEGIGMQHGNNMDLATWIPSSLTFGTQGGSILRLRCFSLQERNVCCMSNPRTLNLMPWTVNCRRYQWFQLPNRVKNCFPRKRHTTSTSFEGIVALHDGHFFSSMAEPPCPERHMACEDAGSLHPLSGLWSPCLYDMANHPKWILSWAEVTRNKTLKTAISQELVSH